MHRAGIGFDTSVHPHVAGKIVVVLHLLNVLVIKAPATAREYFFYSAKRVKFATIHRLQCAKRVKFATIHCLQCAKRVKFTTIHRLHSAKRVKFTTIHRLQCSVEALFATIHIPITAHPSFNRLLPGERSKRTPDGSCCPAGTRSPSRRTGGNRSPCCSGRPTNSGHRCPC